MRSKSCAGSRGFKGKATAGYKMGFLGGVHETAPAREHEFCHRLWQNWTVSILSQAAAELNSVELTRR